MRTAWNAVGASVRGTSHIKNSLPCQDACGHMTLESGVWIGVVSDGAGSAARSELGAQEAVNQTLYVLSTLLGESAPTSEEGWSELVVEAFEHARAKVLQLPSIEGGEARDYACTLTLVIANDEFLAAGQIGDGLAVAMDQDGALTVIAEPQRGEYADATFFLTQPEAPEMFAGRVYRLGHDMASVDALALMTDGLTHLAIERTGMTPHEPFFKPLMRVPGEIHDQEEALEGLIGFLTSERINRRTTDDKTLVLAGRAAG